MDIYMDRNMEVIVEFSQGRIIPRRIRYYDLDHASYIEKDIAVIFYEVIDPDGSRFGIEFSDAQTGILNYSVRSGRWQLSQHL